MQTIPYHHLHTITGGEMENSELDKKLFYATVVGVLSITFCIFAVQITQVETYV